MKTEKQENKTNEEKLPDHSREDFWMDKTEVLEKMHISSRTLQTWRSKRILPFKKIGRKIYYWDSDLRELLRTQKNRH